MTTNKIFKLISSLIVPVAFFVMGIYLIRKENTFAVFIGYANIIFWLAIISVAFYKLATKK